MFFKKNNLYISDINIKYNVKKRLFFTEELDFDPIPNEILGKLEKLLK